MPKKRSLRLGLSALLCLAAGGCATTSSDPTALIPPQIQASVMAEERLLGGGNSGVTVEQMLARARQSGDGPGPAASAAQTQT
ncbi:MAG: hypothetical protein AB1592_00005, partial [Pseudomonadota bacterium]